MKKQNAQWITIPEETVHTPVSEKSHKAATATDAPPVKNKLFWGASFVVLVVVTFTLLAPQQLASIIQGSMFDVPGKTPNANVNLIKPLNIIPQPKTAEQTPAVTGGTPAVTGGTPPEPVLSGVEGTGGAGGGTPTATAPAPQDSNVVQPQIDAVSVQVEPAPVVVEPAPTETGASTVAVGTGGTPPETGGAGGGTPTAPAADVPATPAAPTAAEDANTKMIQDLSKQIEDFKKNDQQKTDTIQQLAGAVQDQLANLKPAAPAAPGVSAANAIGTTAPQTGYRLNPYVVAIQPQAVLSQNLARAQVAQATGVPVYNAKTGISSAVSKNLPRAKGTPKSGPEDTGVLLAITFLSLLGWKGLQLIRD